MTAAENKALMKAIYAGLIKGDSAVFRQHMHENIRLVVTGHNSWTRTLNGVQSIREFYSYFYSRLREPGTMLAERFIADDDIVVVEARGNMVSKSGERYDNQYCMVYQLKDGKIIEMREYLDSSLCERVLGLFPAA